MESLFKAEPVGGGWLIVFELGDGVLLVLKSLKVCFDRDRMRRLYISANYVQVSLRLWYKFESARENTDASFAPTLACHDGLKWTCCPKSRYDGVS